MASHLLKVEIATVRNLSNLMCCCHLSLQNINLVETIQDARFDDGPEEALQDLAEDEFYYHEIVGLDVVIMQLVGFWVRLLKIIKIACQ